MTVVARADSPHFDADGVYRIPFGTAAAPILACSPDKVCSVQLEANEIVLDKVAGDTVRWQIVTGVAGARANVPMIFFKPVDVGTVIDPVATNLIITTNRRIYEMRLQAVKAVSRTRYGFIYGGQNLSAGNRTEIAAAVSPVTTEPTIQTTAEAGSGGGIGGTSSGVIPAAPAATTDHSNPFSLDHNYRWTGETNYKPLGVWNDGINTYIQMPRTAPSPSFYRQTADGKMQMVNVHGPINNIYSVDGMDDHYVLIGAIGKKVPHIDIYKDR